MNPQYKKALEDGLVMMESFPDEITPPLKQAANDNGIEWGAPMQKYMDWAYKQLGVDHML